MDRLTSKPAHFLLEKRIFVLLFLFVLLVVSLFGLQRFYPSIDPKQHTFISKEEQKKEQFYAEQFDDSYPIIFYIEPLQGQSIFSLEALQLQEELIKRAYQQIEGVNDTYSVFSLLPKDREFTLDESFRSWLEQRVSKSALLSKSLIDPEKRSLLLTIYVTREMAADKPVPVEEQPFFKTGQQIQQLREQLSSERFKILVSGVPVMIHQQVVELRRDLVRILVALLFVALLTMTLVIRSPIGIFGAALNAGASLLLLFGGMGLFNLQIDLSFILIPTLLACTISIGYTIHFLNHYRRSIARVGERKLALEIAWKRSFKPLLFTSLTTMVSLLSLLQTRIPVMQIVGAAAAAAILIVFLLTITILPCILSFQSTHMWGKEIKLRRRSIEDSLFVSKVLLQFSSWMLKVQAPLLLLSLFLVVFMSYHLTKIEITLDYTEQMGNRLPFSQERNYLLEKGYVPFDEISLLIALPSEQTLVQDNLEKLEQLKKDMLSLFPHLVLNSSSLADVILDAQQLIYGRNGIPANPRLINGLLLQLRTATSISPSRWINKDKDLLNVSIYIKDYNAEEILKLGSWLKKEVEIRFNNPQLIDIRGFLYEESSKNQLLTYRMLISYGISLLCITLIFWLLFRRLSVTLVAMLPNIFPIIIGGGLLGLFHIKLDYVLMMIAPMVMGLAVDDTIHFCHYALERYHSTKKLMHSLQLTMHHIGVPLIETSLILSFSFLTFLLARTSIIVTMGWLAIVGIVIALLADLTLTPVLMYKVLERLQRKSKNRQCA